MGVPGSVAYYTAHMYIMQAKCLVGEKKETSGMRRVIRAAAVAKYRLKFLSTCQMSGLLQPATNREKLSEESYGICALCIRG